MNDLESAKVALENAIAFREYDRKVRKAQMNESMIDEAKGYISYESDGPTTYDVVIRRALHLARNHKSFSLDDIAEALFDVLGIPTE